TRYYLDSGAGGVAVGVHTTQFEIREPQYDLLKPVLMPASEMVDKFEAQNASRTIIRIAGICGQTEQARQEAELARECGYHIGLLSLGALKEASDDQLIEHAKSIAQIIPIMGFYLQPSVGGRELSVEFWRRFCEIPNVVAVKVAPFHRYQTLDVMRGAAASGRSSEIAFYTGNDDAILYDLLSTFECSDGESVQHLRFVGGLLGHWAFWTKRAVEQMESIKAIRRESDKITANLLELAWKITDVNAAAFDPKNKFAGCIPGIHEILRRQGLLANRNCLNPNETLSPGQMEEIDRVYRAYPHLNDDAFVKENLDRWLS
ncbi:dihydrodipicolinate synthase family protein, partial [bacterium]|nr:dihydrodipicolinate synthase family protein [bacterium]